MKQRKGAPKFRRSSFSSKRPEGANNESRQGAKRNKLLSKKRRSVSMRNNAPGESGHPSRKNRRLAKQKQGSFRRDANKQLFNKDKKIKMEESKPSATHKVARLQDKQKKKETDAINKKLILSHISSGTSSKDKLMALVADIHSRGLKQRLTKKIRAMA